MKTPRKNSEAIKAWADGEDVQIKAGETWLDIKYPTFFDNCEYRVKPPEDPYQHLKEARARGDQIEVMWGCSWQPVTQPNWLEPVGAYRIAAKKEPPPKQPYSPDTFTGEWVREKSPRYSQAFRVVEVACDGIQFGTKPFTRWVDLMVSEKWEWATERNGQWHPFYL